jgi:energy-coupling factor transport system ATP-binding protein
VCFGYPAAGEVIRDLSFTIKKGEFVAVIGENGAGKSTSLRLVDGLLKPSSGAVTVAGMDTSKTKISALAKHVGFLFQTPTASSARTRWVRNRFGWSSPGKRRANSGQGGPND